MLDLSRLNGSLKAVDAIVEYLEIVTHEDEVIFVNAHETHSFDELRHIAW